VRDWRAGRLEKSGLWASKLSLLGRQVLRVLWAGLVEKGDVG
jgi:hypothetical protein